MLMSPIRKPKIQSQFRTIDGLSIRFAESEQRDDHALLFCPWPESVYAYEAIWDRLAERTHLVAVDLPGFGRSERRDALMSPQAMGEFIVLVADSFGLEWPHVVAPDVGTGAALFAAALHPGRLRTLTIGTGGAAVPLQLGGVLKEWVEAPDLEPYRKIDGREVVKRVMETLDQYRPTDAAREDYLASYAGDRFAESMRYVRTYPKQLPLLAGLLPGIRTPVQIIQGEHDRVVPPVNGRFLRARLPNSTLHTIIDAGHFIWEDAADLYADLITRWWDGGYVMPRQSVSTMARPLTHTNVQLPPLHWN
jgi:pimeloyl-ACP methyl ester carboxylesterase